MYMRAPPPPYNMILNIIYIIPCARAELSHYERVSGTNGLMASRMGSRNDQDIGLFFYDNACQYCTSTIRIIYIVSLFIVLCHNQSQQYYGLRLNTHVKREFFLGTSLIAFNWKIDQGMNSVWKWVQCKSLIAQYKIHQLFDKNIKNNTKDIFIYLTNIR